MGEFDPVAYINEPRWHESRMGLERTRELLDRLGNPQDELRFVHVAGTNGKGSVCAYAECILRRAGYKTGLFTSPYLFAFEERIRVEGACISREDLTRVTLQVKEAADAMEDHPTEFELMTAVALVHFAQQQCEIVVLEVGLGGRLDSTNVIDEPEVSVIARIGLDHTALLGSTLGQIAQEKAGIIKESCPVVTWPQEAEAFETIDLRAAERGATLATADFSRLRIEAAPTVDDPCWCFSYCGLEGLRTRLLGAYQPFNAALAIEAARVLRERGWSISEEAVREGVEHAVWHGRFEAVSRDPLFVVDGGHNPQGAQALADTLRQVFPDACPVFLIGVLEDKDYPEMLEAILPLGGAFVCITPDNPRALPAHKLARAVRWTGQDLLGCSACVNPYVARSVADGVARARELAGPDGMVVAFGSLYSLADVEAALDEAGALREDARAYDGGEAG